MRWTQTPFTAIAALFITFIVSYSQTNPASLVADEMIKKGFEAFRSGNFVEAETLLQRFISDFGKSAEAKPHIEKITAFIIQCQGYNKKWSKVIDNVDEFLRLYPKSSFQEDVRFWLAIAYLREDQHKEGRAEIDLFLKNFPQSTRANLLYFLKGTSFLTENQPLAAVPIFEELMNAGASPINNRATLLYFYAQLENGNNKNSLEAFEKTYTRLDQIDDITTFHMLALKLGDHLLSQEQNRDALSVLQKVWPQNRIITHQEERRKQLLSQLEHAQRTPNASAQVVEIEDSLAQIDSGLKTFSAIKDYDTALRLRIMQCYFKLERYREAALWIEDMARTLPDGPLLEESLFRLAACYSNIGRTDRVVTAANQFAERFPQSKHVPAVLFAKGEAQLQAKLYQDAEKTFIQLHEQYKNFEKSDQVYFLIGYTKLLQEKYAEAVAHYETFRSQYPKSILLENALYWLAQAHNYNKDYPAARKAIADYLHTFPSGAYQADVHFLNAYTYFSELNFDKAIIEIEAFLKKFPDSARVDQALYTLGESYFAVANIEAGINRFRKISHKNRRLAEQAYFQIGKGLKGLEMEDALLDHFVKFPEVFPDSPRVPEALLQVAKIYQSRQQIEEARKLYWQGIQKHGNDPSNSGVEDLLTSLSRLYKSEEERKDLDNRLTQYTTKALEEKQTVFAARLLWAHSKIIRRKEPQRARLLLLKAGETISPDLANPLLLADYADLLREDKRYDSATKVYTDMLKWHPLSRFRDRAFAGLGLIARAQSRNQDALAWFTRFEKESIQSALLPQVLQAKAEIYLEQKKYTDAITTYEELLKAPNARGLPTVIALKGIAEAYMTLEKPEKAIPYYQRIYIMYGRYTDAVAQAYWRSGQAFEQLKMTQEARQTYQEFIEQEHLNTEAPYAKAKARLKELGG
jgi:TolA-binding protein